MHIAEVLERSAEASNAHLDVMYLQGVLEKDHDVELFRLYPEPGNYGSYFLIRTDDVAGELKELNRDELLRAGVVGMRVFLVPLRSGTRLLSVEVTRERLGESVEGLSSARLEPVASSGCRATSGCGNRRCCTTRRGKCRCNSCCIAAADE